MTSLDDMQRQLLEAFADESAELLARMAQSLVAAERGEEAAVADALLQLRRDLHTLKGSAGAVGQTNIAVVGHALEDMIASVGDRQPTPQELDLMHRTVQFLAATSRDEATEEASTMLAALEAWEFAEAPSELPPVPAIANPPITASPDAATPEAAPLAPIPPPSPEVPVVAARVPAARVADSLRVSAAKVDELQAVVGDLVVNHLALLESAQRFTSVRDDTAELTGSWRRLHSVLRTLRDAVPPRTWSKLEIQMHEFASEIAGIHRDCFGLSSTAQRQVGQLGILAESLDGGLKALRMLPVVPWYESFQATVRDAARQVGCEVRLVVEPTDIEVDRVILERLRDPVLHILRNAVAHGMETPEMRVAAGKAPVGEIRVSTERTGERVQMRIHDDGRGVDRDAVRRRATQARLLADGETLDDRRLLEILAHVGFSTAGQVSAVSGRGVGLNVALDTVQDLGGFVSLRSTQGSGTTFEFAVPAVTTSSTGIVVVVGTHRIGIPVQSVDRLLRIEANEIEQLDKSSVIRVENAPVALASLAVLLGAPEHAVPMNTGRIKTVVLRSGHTRLAVTVNDVVQDLPMTVRPLGAQFERMRHYGGCAVEADGSLLLVLDVRELVRVAQRAGRGRLEAAVPRVSGEPGHQERQRVILVIDDSITTRTLERNILEAAGYRVISACDGQEGLEVLMTTGGIDLVVTDIDMPRMDGFELCQRIRHGNLSHLPVIMVTSRNTEEEKVRGSQSGADAFIVKRDFDQTRLLGIIERLLG